MSSPPDMSRLLCLDDDPQIGVLLKTVAGIAGFECSVAPSAREFFEKFDMFRPTVVTLDLQVPEMDGIEVLRQLAEKDPECSILLISGMDARTVGAAEFFAKSLGLTLIGTILKPFEPEQLVDLLTVARSRSMPLTLKDFSRAIEQGELIVHYQPVAARASYGWAVDAVEALLRWDHPQRGLLMPNHFIRFAADETLSRAMTDYVISASLEQLRGWRAANFEVGLRINISAALLTDVEFPDRLEMALIANEIPTDWLTIEVNETAMLEERPHTIDVLTRLRLKNIGLAIDDFGIGYSSLTQLFRMPFSEMKIDQSLIGRCTESREGRIAVEALIGLAHKLDLRVCAEGVESQDVIDFLWYAGCESAQGYLISQPLTAREIRGAARHWQESELRRREHNGTRVENTGRFNQR